MIYMKIVREKEGYRQGKGEIKRINKRNAIN